MIKLDISTSFHILDMCDFSLILVLFYYENHSEMIELSVK